MPRQKAVQTSFYTKYLTTGARLQKKRVIKQTRLKKEGRGKPVKVYSVVDYWEYNTIYHNRVNTPLSVK